MTNNENLRDKVSPQEKIVAIYQKVPLEMVVPFNPIQPHRVIGYQIWDGRQHKDVWVPHEL